MSTDKAPDKAPAQTDDTVDYVPVTVVTIGRDTGEGTRGRYAVTVRLSPPSCVDERALREACQAAEVPATARSRMHEHDEVLFEVTFNSHLDPAVRNVAIQLMYDEFVNQRRVATNVY